MLKWLKYVAGVFALILALLIYKGWASDIPHEVLAEKYATGASDFIDLPSGASAHYRTQGNRDGQTLVLLHGSNASLHTWEPWVETLSNTFFLVTVDLPGHGLTGATPADDYTYDGMVTFLKEFTESVGLETFALGGNSMGGGITLAYALKHPEDLTHLILVDAAGIAVPVEPGEERDYPIAFDLAGRWYTDWILENVTPRSLAAEGLETSVSVKSIVTEEMIDQYWELARHPGNRRATGKRFAWYRQNGSRDLNVTTISLPSLIIWGDEDKLIPVSAAHILDERLQNSELRIFQGVGHLPMEEVANETAAAVSEFLTRNPP